MHFVDYFSGSIAVGVGAPMSIMVISELFNATQEDVANYLKHNNLI